MQVRAGICGHMALSSCTCVCCTAGDCEPRELLRADLALAIWHSQHMVLGSGYVFNSHLVN